MQRPGAGTVILILRIWTEGKQEHGFRARLMTVRPNDPAEVRFVGGTVEDILRSVGAALAEHGIEGRAGVPEK